MKTSIQLSKNLAKLQNECIEKVLSFFEGKRYTRILFSKSQNDLTIEYFYEKRYVKEINSDGQIIFSVENSQTPKIGNLIELSADALLTILDELERMKKCKQLMKP